MVMSAQNTPCKFNEKTFQFAGTPVEQARCLLRPNGRGGELGPELEKLPSPIEKLVGKATALRKDKLRKYLKELNVSEDTIGGSLDLPLSSSKLPDGSSIQAMYFVIHDTSSPYLRDEPFPENFDTDKAWRGNNLSIWINQPVAHIFVNRLGESITTTPFAETTRKGWGTKFAREVLKADGKGMQLHIELVQPRRRDSNDRNPNNDLIAPTPGFTPGQYEKLALLYICAGVRRGTWLIPGYHSAFDAGIKGAHDDPQNFELEKFASALKKLLKKLN